MVSSGIVPVVITTFLASAVEAVEMVAIVVGVGATRGWRSTIFGAFSQVSGQSTRRFGGTGLGLAITKRLTEMMHGTITLRSAGAPVAQYSFQLE